MSFPDLAAHIPDANSHDGLMHIVLLGNYVELCQVSFALQHLPQTYREEIRYARWMFHRFQRWFSVRYNLAIRGIVTHPMALFRRALLSFFGTVLSVAVQTRPTNISRQCRHDLHALLDGDHSELVEDFKVEAGGNSYFWMGPDFSIILRSHNPGTTKFDFRKVKSTNT
jgi:hypothetical protein